MKEVHWTLKVALNPEEWGVERGMERGGGGGWRGGGGAVAKLANNEGIPTLFFVLSRTKYSKLHQ